MTMTIVALQLNTTTLMNLKEAVGIRKVQESIIIGNATIGDISKANTSAIKGAYNPAPTVMKAPKIKFSAMVITS